MTDKTQAIASLPDVTSRGNESEQKTGTDDCDTEVTSNSQKVGKTGNNCQPSLTEEEKPKLIKPHFEAKKGEKEIAADEIRTHDVQLGKLAFYH